MILRIFHELGATGISESYLLLNHFLVAQIKGYRYFMTNSSHFNSLGSISYPIFAWTVIYDLNIYWCCWPRYEQICFCPHGTSYSFAIFPPENANDQLLWPWGQRHWSMQRLSERITLRLKNKDREDAKPVRRGIRALWGAWMTQHQSCRMFPYSFTSVFEFLGCRLLLALLQTATLMVITTAAGGLVHSRALTPPSPHIASLCNRHV